MAYLLCMLAYKIIYMKIMTSGQGTWQRNTFMALLQGNNRLQLRCHHSVN